MPAIYKKDFKIITVIGALVGILSQPIITNIAGLYCISKLFALFFAFPAMLGGAQCTLGILPTLNTITFAFRVGVFIQFIILAPFALFIASLLGKFIPALYQFAKFAAVGVLNTFIDLGVLNLEILISGMPQGIAYTIFKAISFVFATTNSFFWNKYWTFNATNQLSAAETSKFYIVAVVGWVFNVSIASFVVNGIGHPASVSPYIWANVGALVGVAGAFLWDFFGYKYLVFKAHEPPKA